MAMDKTRVLIVDDEPGIGRIFGLKLKLCGFDVVSSTSGAEAIDLVRGGGYDVVLLDVLMPGMSGLEVLSKVREFSEIPIIIFTARADIFEIAKSLGANAYVSKPLNPDHLIEKIKAVLSKDSKSHPPASGI